jgi:hypothetical protein
MPPVPDCRFTLGWSPLWMAPEPYAWDAVCYHCGAIIASLSYGTRGRPQNAGRYLRTLVRAALVVRPMRDGVTGLPCYSVRRRVFVQRTNADRGPVTVGPARHTRGWSTANGPICAHCANPACRRHQRVPTPATYGRSPSADGAWARFVDPMTGLDVSSSPDVVDPVPREPSWWGEAKPITGDLLLRYHALIGRHRADPGSR